jgi:hypothetical protein
MGNLARAIGAIGIVGGAIAHEDEIAAVRILAPAEIRNNAQYFRGTGSYHHVLGCSACRKLPDVGVKARCLGEIAAHKFDAVHTTNEARRHSQAATACRRLSPSADLALV